MKNILPKGAGIFINPMLPSSMSPEVIESYISPELPVSTQSTQALNVNYEGGSYCNKKEVRCSKLLCYITSLTAGGQQRFLIYQNPTGNAGTLIPKIASGTLSPVATGINQLSFEQGLVTFAPGLLFVMVGKPTAINSALQTYGTAAFNLLVSNVSPLTHPLVFTTAIPVAGADPVTFNPNAQPASTVNVVPIIRLVA